MPAFVYRARLDERGLDSSDSGSELVDLLPRIAPPDDTQDEQNRRPAAAVVLSGSKRYSTVRCTAMLCLQIVYKAFFFWHGCTRQRTIDRSSVSMVL